MASTTAPKSHLGQLSPAKTLQEISRTLTPDPLESKEELKAFYKEEIQQLRQVDRMGEIRIGLEDALASGQKYKAFVMGHPGVGKTTEIFRLLQKMEPQLQPLRISITEELNPGTLRYYDILLLILLRLVRAAGDPTVIGFADNELTPMLDRVKSHLARRWTKHLQIEANEFGGGLELPFIVKLQGNLKHSRTREEGKEEYEVSFVTELVALMNDVLAECNQLLGKHQNGKQWLLFVDDFEKIGAAPSLIRDLFVALRPVFEGLNSHMLVMIPVWLYHSEDSSIILPANFQNKPLKDIPVYDKAHIEDPEVLKAVMGVVTSRVEATLFEDEVLERCCVASGGNFRDLFALIRDAMLTTRLRGGAAISNADLEVAIAGLREEYELRLGTTGQESIKETLDEKLDYLVSIYHGNDPKTKVPTPVQYLLLRHRFVLHYNGIGWLGVHPLVVDLLIKFKKLEEGSPGGSQL